MPKYYVVVREVWTQTVEISAGSKEEAILAVSRDSGKLLDDTSEYSHRMDPSTWTVDEVGEDDLEDTKKFKAGDSVFYWDPKGLRSGRYVINAVLDEDMFLVQYKGEGVVLEVPLRYISEVRFA